MACLNFDSPLSLTAGSKVFDISNPNNSMKVKWVHLWGVTSLWGTHCLEIKVTKISLEKYCWCKIRQVVHPRLYICHRGVVLTRELRFSLVYSPPGSRDFPVFSSPWGRSGHLGVIFQIFKACNKIYLDNLSLNRLWVTKIT
jgi:hypothetical protein